jgi:signal peptide peptidase SppA
MKCFFNKICSKIKTKTKVNVLNLDGVIGSVGMKQGLSIGGLNEAIEKAFNGKNIAMVVLNINSPGGSPAQSELIAKRIRNFSNKKKIPVVAIVEDIAASGGYWLACAADKIIVADNSLVGSLGVKFSGFGFVKAISNIGVERRVYTKGESKAILDPFLPEKEEDIEIILRVQQDIYQNFKDHVFAARQGKLNIAEEELFSGAIWSGREAINIGLADEIGDLYSYVENRFGDAVELVTVNQEKSWLKRKLGLSLDFLLGELLNFFASKKIELR